MRESMQKTTPATKFKRGQFVLYRDPEKFWTGQPGHTFVCRIDQTYMDGTYGLAPLTSGNPIFNANPEYMRLLPSVDAMRDIDTAPLNTDGAADDMTAAAIAWLTQQHAIANTPPGLPAPRG
ncbi:hypothetical protein [Streptomyces sp. NBC_01789]|uniref:hypothetical protein n=1 Tax=Streptomyces sp. NBC_01789 TaxID=2975941 RepID=UPI00225AD3D9|nr:hypothetical protein [Streptomyces sp. NBC_01789]MCX4451655.1 hypothetical protein [Streptomyces sp. NBC_01789]